MNYLYNKIHHKIFGYVALKTKQRLGRVLLSYITKPFTNKKISNNHTNEWECFTIASLFIEAGYAVDVIDWNNTTFIPHRRYDIFIDIFSNLERLSYYLKDTRKIFHITGAHWQVMNHAEYTRLLELKERRGVALKPNRSVKPCSNIENADIATCLGNDWTSNTYSYANKPIFKIPISTTHEFDKQDKDFDKIRKNFVWVGGSGAVHKGLDRVLEVFVSLPDYRLTVIGPVAKEADFTKTYYKELYETPNIKYMGWLDLGGNMFSEIRKNTLGIVYPSCSEGGGGSVVTMLHAGIIPIVTKQSSVDTHEFGINLVNDSIETIRDAVISLSKEPIQKLKERSESAQRHAQTHHTRSHFRTAFKEFLYNEVIK